jgi:hypothetical protein
MNSLLSKLPNVCTNIGKIVCNTKQAYIVNILNEQHCQYLYSFGHTNWNKTTYQTLIKNPIRIYQYDDNKQKDKLSRIYHPDEIIYPMMDYHDNNQYIINNGDNIYFGILYLGFTQKIIIVPKSMKSNT